MDLDARISSIFYHPLSIVFPQRGCTPIYYFNQVSPIEEVKIPNLKGKTEQEVRDTLRKLKLNFRTVSEQISSDESEINKVVSQSSPAGTQIKKAGSFGITIVRQE